MIYGIIYGDKTTEYTPYFAKKTATPWRFENDHMIKICSELVSTMPDNQYLGIFSHKFYQKTRKTKADVYHAMDNCSTDVINFSPNIRLNIQRYGTFMDWSDQGHIGIKSMVQRCCKHVGIEYNNDPEHIIFANQFVAKKTVYCDYIDNCIVPCLELLEGEMWDEVNRPAGYTAGMELEQLKKHTGLDFYNYIPFVLERMAMQWFKDITTW